MKNNNKTNDIILSIKNLKMYFPVYKGILRKVSGYCKAIDDINLSIRKNEILGLVGESGSGKTTLAKCILRLIIPTGGDIYYNFDNSMKSLLHLNKIETKRSKKEIQVIFQDPYSSLNPSMSIYNMMVEPMRYHGIKDSEEINNTISKLFEYINLSPEYVNRFPHEFSGGQRQRIGIARALSVNPKLVICDEPISALDVSIQAQILNILEKLKYDLNLTYLFITHDLSVIDYICDRVVVMYLGKIVEILEVKKLNKKIKHPYSEALFSAIPVPDLKRKSKRIILKGEIPDPTNPPAGCKFHTRCNYADLICSKEEPELKHIKEENEHLVACHMVNYNPKYNRK